MNIFITGCSRGLGKAVANYYVKNNDTIFGLSRTEPTNKIDVHFKVDMQDHKKLEECLFNFDKDIDILYLNAGILGGLNPQKNVKVDSLKNILDINLFSQKIILDELLKRVKIKNVVCISSGAANKCRYGWGNYALSKASLKMLIQIYACENKDTHFISISPGLIDTDMQKEVYNTDENIVPSVVDFKKKKDENMIESPEEIAKKIITFIDDIDNYDSGSFVDLRKL